MFPCRKVFCLYCVAWHLWVFKHYLSTTFSAYYTHTHTFVSELLLTWIVLFLRLKLPGCQVWWLAILESERGSGRKVPHGDPATVSAYLRSGPPDWPCVLENLRLLYTAWIYLCLAALMFSSTPTLTLSNHGWGRMGHTVASVLELVSVCVDLDYNETFCKINWEIYCKTYQRWHKQKCILVKCCVFFLLPKIYLASS